VALSLDEARPVPRLALLALFAPLAIGSGACKRAPDGDKTPAPPARADDAGAELEVPRETHEPAELPRPPPLAATPRGLPPPPPVSHNPTTPAKVELGQLLFFEPALSGTGKMACASCHRPERGLADGEPRSTTASERQNLRHTPSLWNVAYFKEWGWDGAMPTLEAHVLAHWRGQLAASDEAVTSALASARGYADRFQRAFGSPPSRDRIAEALAAFARAQQSGDSPWDRREAGDRKAVSPDVVAGSRVFSERAGCATCHTPPLYTDRGYHDRGVDESRIDPGRARATGDVGDEGAFRTPTLRGAVHTAPYFHDGSIATLEQAVDHELARSQVTLTGDERAQLLAFLAALSPEAAPPAPAPELPVIP
jgi:cytochrome c peroxidase